MQKPNYHVFYHKFSAETWAKNMLSKTCQIIQNTMFSLVPLETSRIQQLWKSFASQRKWRTLTTVVSCLLLLLLVVVEYYVVIISFFARTKEKKILIPFRSSWLFFLCLKLSKQKYYFHSVGSVFKCTCPECFYSENVRANSNRNFAKNEFKYLSLVDIIWIHFDRPRQLTRR